MVMVWQSFIIESEVVTEQHQAESNEYYDFYAVYFSEIGSLAQGQKATYAHHPGIDLNTIYQVQDPFIFHNQISINGQVFNSIYETSDNPSNAVYNKPGEGVIAFKKGGVIWLKNW